MEQQSTPVMDPAYWLTRIEDVKRRERPEHTMVFVCGEAKWRRVEDKHREILARHITPLSYVLDAGCGYGRLLDLMPGVWNRRQYTGVDVSPDFIDLAERKHPHLIGAFSVGDLRNLKAFADKSFDFGVLISIKHMIIRNCGEDVWNKMETELSRVCRNLLYLEYDELDEGTLVCCPT